MQYTSLLNGELYKSEVSAQNMKEAAEKFIKENSRKFLNIYEKPSQEIKEVDYVEDAEDALYEMDLKGADFVKYKGHNRKAVTITRKQCEEYLAYRNAISKFKKFSCRQALAS